MAAGFVVSLTMKIHCLSANNFYLLKDEQQKTNECVEYCKMPKMKTHSGAAKRFKKTANGFKHKQAFKSHILTKKSTKRKRQLRGCKQVAASDQPLIRRMLA